MECHVRPLSVECASAVHRPDCSVQPTVPNAQPCLPTKVRSATRNPFSGPERGTGARLVGGGEEDGGDDVGAAEDEPGEDGAAVVLTGVDCEPEPDVLEVQPATSTAEASAGASTLIRTPLPSNHVPGPSSSRAATPR